MPGQRGCWACEDSKLSELAASLLTCQPRPFERDIIIVRSLAGGTLAGRGPNQEERD
jgi:hypothetical protein